MTDVTEAAPVRRTSTVLVDDRFEEDVPAGHVVGSWATSGAPRLGVDVEHLMGVDDAALRIRPLTKAGWGREGIAYGPFARRPGLAFAAHVLNGHNASQTFYEPETPRQRLRRTLGDLRRGRLRRPKHFENLAVGWFTDDAPRNPLRAGNGFVMHAVDGSNGELWATCSHRPVTVARGVQNLEILYVVVLRRTGAMYYAASVEGATGLGAHPGMRPLGLDHRASERMLYAGIHQRILGEVGYRVDTRVHHARVADVPALAAWYGSAHVADRLDPAVPPGTPAEVGGAWARWGTAGGGVDEARIIEAPTPSGLVHVLVHGGSRPAAAGVLLRARRGAGWRVLLGPDGCELSVNEGAGWQRVRFDPEIRLTARSARALQVLDDGEALHVHVDGLRAFGSGVVDERLAACRGVGVHVGGGTEVLAQFEAHPRTVPIPDVLDLGAPWTATGDVVVVDEHFAGPAGDLDGVATPDGTRSWERSVGVGSIRRTGRSSAQVDAAPLRPNPGRTVYTVAWDDPSFVDVTVDMVPPGSGPGQGEEFRGGLVLWQDPENYVVLNLFLDNVYDGSSISTFYRLGGHEDMYDAVWSLVGPVRWGVPCRLRVVSDGWRFLAHLDGEPVLHRSFRDVYPWTGRLALNRVGIVANEEWGDDTGTEFTRFVARGRRPDVGAP